MHPLRILGVPHAALLSVSFGLMAVSFPMGAYVFFEQSADGDIGPGYPLDLAYPALSWMEDSAFRPSVGDAFVAAWSLYAALFAVCVMGKHGLAGSLSLVVSEGRETPSAMLAVLRWLGIVVLASALIGGVQGLFGVGIDAPAFGSDLERFLGATLAPLLEEPAFRVLLIGAPLAAFAWRPGSMRSLVRALWRPHDAGPHNKAQVAVLIAASAALFGASHVIGDNWSYGKAAQATVAGLILGWAYYRHGAAAAIVLHWATNYFVLSYAYMTARLTGTDITGAFEHNLLSTIEAVLLASGAASAVFVVARYKSSRAARQNSGL